MARHKRPLPPELTTPIAAGPSRLGVVFDDSTGRKRWAPVLEVLKQRQAKIDALVDLYDIDPQDDQAWKCLALSLAQDYLPGFVWVRRAGRHRAWDDLALINLRLAVESKTAEGVSARRACGELLAAPVETRGFPFAKTAATLYRRYHESKRRLR